MGTSSCTPFKITNRGKHHSFRTWVMVNKNEAQFNLSTIQPLNLVKNVTHWLGSLRVIYLRLKLIGAPGNKARTKLSKLLHQDATCCFKSMKSLHVMLLTNWLATRTFLLFKSRVAWVYVPTIAVSISGILNFLHRMDWLRCLWLFQVDFDHVLGSPASST